MFKITRKAPGFDGNIVAGNTVTLRLPIGLTYHQVWIEYAFAEADSDPVALAAAVGEVRVVANGKPIWNIQASELDTINQFQSRAAAAGLLCIDFDRYNLRSKAAEEFTSIGTGHAQDPTPLTTFVIELDIKSGSGVASGTLTARMRQSEPRPLGLFKKIRRYTDSYAGAGTFEKADYPKGELVNALYMFESANDIDHVRLERDDVVIFDRSKELNARIQNDGVRTSQSNLYAYDTSEDGNGTEQLATLGVHDLRWFLTIDGAMTVTSLVEYLGGLER